MPDEPRTTQVKIYKATARIDDSAALDQLLSFRLDSAKLAGQIRSREPGSKGTYDEIAHILNWVVSDGEIATRFRIEGLTLAEAKAISDECDNVAAPDGQAILDIVNRVLGTSFPRFQ